MFYKLNVFTEYFIIKLLQTQQKYGRHYESTEIFTTCFAVIKLFESTFNTKNIQDFQP